MLNSGDHRVPSWSGPASSQAAPATAAGSTSACAAGVSWRFGDRQRACVSHVSASHSSCGCLRVDVLSVVSCNDAVLTVDTTSQKQFILFETLLSHEQCSRRWLTDYCLGIVKYSNLYVHCDFTILSSINP